MTIVVYFSHAGQNYFSGGYKYLTEGNASKIAKKVKQKTNADIFEVVAEKPYPEGYKECCDVALAEQRQNAFPKLVADKDISKYDTVILVYPCWWGTLPRPMFTFITSHSFAGKKVCPICTHEGSGMGGSEVDLKRLCTGATLVKGLAVQGSYADNCDSALDGWLKTL